MDVRVPPEIEAQLHRRAALKGQEAGQYVQELVARHLAVEGSGPGRTHPARSEQGLRAAARDWRGLELRREEPAAAAPAHAPGRAVAAGQDGLTPSRTTAGPVASAPAVPPVSVEECFRSTCHPDAEHVHGTLAARGLQTPAHSALQIIVGEHLRRFRHQG